METITIEKKKFVVIEKSEFERLQLLAAQKTTATKRLSLAAGRKHAHKLVAKWASEK